MKARSPRRVSRPACSNIRITPARATSRAAPSPMCCSRATTKKSPSGGAPRPRGSRRSAAPICGRAISENLDQGQTSRRCRCYQTDDRKKEVLGMKNATLLAAAMLLVSGYAACAQDADIAGGQAYAQKVCAACHAVLVNENMSPPSRRKSVSATMC